MSSNNTSKQNQLSHVDEQGAANMVDVSAKSVTTRIAIAEGYISVSEQVLAQIEQNLIAKGDVFSVARIAGIQASKNCANLIPLCHPLMLTKVQIDFEIDAANQQIQ